MMKVVIKYIIAILLERKLVDNKEQARQMHYDFNNEDIMKDIDCYFTTENESTDSTE